MRTWTLVERVVALALTLGVVALLVVWTRGAGGLWRDEVVTVTAATEPTWAGMWSALRNDSFPGLLHALVKVWVASGLGATDPGLRALGLLVGIGMLGALWIAVRPLGAGPPLLSLVLFAWSPLAIQWMASLRAYGLGMLMIVLVVGWTWELVERPDRRHVVRAAAAAILSVQCLYQNGFLVLAVCMGAVAVAARRRAWKTCLLVLAVGALAALSLIPYAGNLRYLDSLKELLPSGLTLERIRMVGAQALAAAGTPMLWAWLSLFVGGVAAAAVVSFRSRGPWSEAERGRALYAGIVMVAGSFAYLMYVKSLGLMSEPWYYLPPLALSAVCLDALFSLIVARAWVLRATRLALVLSLAAWTLPGVAQGVRQRQTNVDVIAADLESRAVAGDAIVVFPWYCGATFDRYYSGAAFWSTIPPHDEIRLQRLERIREAMVQPEPLRPLYERIAASLASGHRVWLVGRWPMFLQDTRPVRLPPAPHPLGGWNIAPYVDSWEQQVGWYLHTHARSAEAVPSTFRGQVNPYENLHLWVIEGWR